MNDLIEAIKAWPIIIQGTLGSGLFWILLVLFKWVSRIVSEYLTRWSKKRRISWLISRECKHDAFGNPDTAAASFAVSVLIYRSLQQAYTGFMWLGLGLIFQNFINGGLVIGGLGLSFYILRAYEVVAPFKEGENTPEARKQVIKELIALGKIPDPAQEKTNNSSNSDAASSAGS